MTVIEHSAQAAEALEGFLHAPGDAVHASLRQLDALLRTPAGDGPARATPAGHAAVPDLVRALAAVPDDRLPHLVLLLGLLADTDAHDLVRAELDPLLLLFGRAPADRRLMAALGYLVALFPEDGDRVLSAVAVLDLSPDDFTRLERCLVPHRPEVPVLARVWPSPAMWALTDEELEADHRIWGGMLPEEQIVTLWESDTRALRDYTALKAIALLDTPPAPYRPERDHAEPEAVAAGTDPGTVAATAAGRLAPFAGLLACPDCRGPLALDDTGARCPACDRVHPAGEGWVDLSSAAGEGIDAMILNDLSVVPRYERGLRPAFLRVMGHDFQNLVSVEDEIAFLRTELRPAEGPVLDLAAGSGRFTRVVADLVGADRLIALDLSTSMLAALQRSGPALPAVRASALRLPFTDGSLGAVNCWNALQALPDQGQAIAEVGRVLRPGGTFTLFTYRPDDDVLYREFQIRHEKALRVTLPGREQIGRWIDDAGLDVREESGPGGYLFISAVRRP